MVNPTHERRSFRLEEENVPARTIWSRRPDDTELRERAGEILETILKAAHKFRHSPADLRAQIANLPGAYFFQAHLKKWGEDVPAYVQGVSTGERLKGMMLEILDERLSK